MQLKEWDKNWNNPLTTGKDFPKIHRLYPHMALSWWLTQLSAAHLKITIERSPLLASVPFRKREFTDRNDLWYKQWETPRPRYRCFSKEALFGSKYILVSPTFGTDTSDGPDQNQNHNIAQNQHLWCFHFIDWFIVWKFLNVHCKLVSNSMLWI